MIADDHTIFRNGLCEMIASTPGLDLAAEATSGAQALELIRLLKPAVAVLDVHMPGGSGLDVARAIKGEGLAVRSPNASGLSPQAMLTSHPVSRTFL